jgi:hypothetical protein
MCASKKHPQISQITQIQKALSSGRCAGHHFADHARLQHSSHQFFALRFELSAGS